MRLLLMFCASLSACAPEVTPPEPVPSLSPSVDLGPSIYGLQMSLQDQAGRAHGLDVNAGHPTLVSMFYGSCRSACPLLITDLKRVDAEATAAGHADLRVLMVSFDPERDTPQVLTGLVEQHDLDVERWRLSAPTTGDARSLSAVLDIAWREVGNGMFQHDSVLILLNPEGQELARLDGLNQDPAPLLAALEAL